MIVRNDRKYLIYLVCLDFRFNLVFSFDFIFIIIVIINNWFVWLNKVFNFIVLLYCM